MGLVSGRKEGAAEAWLRSAQTGSLIPTMLRGKSPCLGAESASGRPQGSGEVAGGDAVCGAAALGLGRLQQQRHAMSVRKRAPTERGSLSACPRRRLGLRCVGYKTALN